MDGVKAFPIRLVRGAAAKPVLSVAALLGVIVLIGLGTWQLQRLRWKEGLVAAVEARVERAPIPYSGAHAAFEAGGDMEYLPVYAEGVFVHAAEAHVFGTLGGEAGWYVFTPLRLERALAGGETHIYVNRGFVPLKKKSRETRADGLVEGVVRVEGLYRAPQSPSGVSGAFQPASDPAANEWHVRDPRLFAEAAGLEAAPGAIDSFGREAPGAWPKGGVTRIEFRNNHREYALTWFGLALTLAGVWAAFAGRTR